MSEKKILLVEDEVLIAISKQRQLQSYGYIVDHVESGEEAIRYTLQSEKDIDLILMDINLVEMPGTQAAKIILSFKDIPIVFLSSHSEPDIVQETENISSYGYVIKDSSMFVLDASIKMAFKLFEANKNLTQIEKFKNKIFDNSNMPFVLLETESFTCVECNEAATKVYGFENRSELLGKTFLDFSAPTQYHDIDSSRKLKSIINLALADESVFFNWKNQKPTGELWDSDVQMLALKSDGKTFLQYSIFDVTPTAILINEKNSSSLERISKQKKAISELVFDSSIYKNSFFDALNKINEYITDTLDVQRSSIWVLNETDSELKQISAYDSSTKLCEHGTCKTIDFPKNFVSIMNENRLYCVDILNDPRTKNLAEFYNNFGIGALLSVGFFVDGKLKGLVCSEHVGETREWHPDEESFSSTVAAIVGQLFVREDFKMFI